MAQNISMGSGSAALGAALGGRNTLRRSAYDERMNELAKAFVQAQMGRKYQSETALNNDTLSARGDLGQAFGNAYNLPPDAASALAVLGRAATTSNPEQLANIGMRREATHTTDPLDANRILAAIAGKPRDLTQISGNTAFNPTATPDQPMATTDVGKAMAAADMARATDAMASARLSNVKANAGGFSPNTGSGGHDLPAPSRIKAILPTTVDPKYPYMEPKVNPADEAAVFAWLAQHPGANVGDYMRQSPVGSPGALPPAGTMPLADMLTQALQGGAAAPAPDAVAPATPAPMPTAAVPPQAVQFLRTHANDPTIIAAFQAKYGVDPRAYLTD